MISVEMGESILGAEEVPLEFGGCHWKDIKGSSR